LRAFSVRTRLVQQCVLRIVIPFRLTLVVRDQVARKEIADRAGVAGVWSFYIWVGKDKTCGLIED
jgi:hypothetical protein